MRTGDNFFRDDDMQREFWPECGTMFEPQRAFGAIDAPSVIQAGAWCWHDLGEHGGLPCPQVYAR